MRGFTKRASFCNAFRGTHDRSALRPSNLAVCFRILVASLAVLFHVVGAGAEDSLTEFYGAGWFGSLDDESGTRCVVRARDAHRGAEIRISTEEGSTRALTLRFPNETFKGENLVPTRLYITAKSAIEIVALAKAEGTRALTIRDVYPSDFWSQIAEGASLRVFTKQIEWTFALSGYDDASAFLERCTRKEIRHRMLDPRGGPHAIGWKSRTESRSQLRPSRSLEARGL